MRIPGRKIRYGQGNSVRNRRGISLPVAVKEMSQAWCQLEHVAGESAAGRMGIFWEKISEIAVVLRLGPLNRSNNSRRNNHCDKCETDQKIYHN
jgi:hypothetical protein